jgi:hypothetical protein
VSWLWNGKSAGDFAAPPPHVEKCRNAGGLPAGKTPEGTNQRVINYSRLPCESRSQFRRWCFARGPQFNFGVVATPAQSKRSEDLADPKEVALAVPSVSLMARDEK